MVVNISEEEFEDFEVDFGDDDGPPHQSPSRKSGSRISVTESVDGKRTNKPSRPQSSRRRRKSNKSHRDGKKRTGRDRKRRRPRTARPARKTSSNDASFRDTMFSMTGDGGVQLVPPATESNKERRKNRVSKEKPVIEVQEDDISDLDDEFDVVFEDDADAGVPVVSDQRPQTAPQMVHQSVLDTLQSTEDLDAGSDGGEGEGLRGTGGTAPLTTPSRITGASLSGPFGLDAASPGSGEDDSSMDEDINAMDEEVDEMEEPELEDPAGAEARRAQAEAEAAREREERLLREEREREEWEEERIREKEARRTQEEMRQRAARQQMEMEAREAEAARAEKAQRKEEVRQILRESVDSRDRERAEAETRAGTEERPAGGDGAGGGTPAQPVYDQAAVGSEQESAMMEAAEVEEAILVSPEEEEEEVREDLETPAAATAAATPESKQAPAETQATPVVSEEVDYTSEGFEPEEDETNYSHDFTCLTNESALDTTGGGAGSRPRGSGIHKSSPLQTVNESMSLRDDDRVRDSGTQTAAAVPADGGAQGGRVDAGTDFGRGGGGGGAARTPIPVYFVAGPPLPPPPSSMAIGGAGGGGGGGTAVLYQTLTAAASAAGPAAPARAVPEAPMQRDGTTASGGAGVVGALPASDPLYAALRGQLDVMLAEVEWARRQRMAAAPAAAAPAARRGARRRRAAGARSARGAAGEGGSKGKTFRYTTLAATRKFISANRPKPLTFAEAQAAVALG